MKGRKINPSLLIPSIVISIFLLLPFFFLVVIGISGSSEVWEHVSRFLLFNYILNTILILASVSILSLLWGILPAYLISNFKFPGSRFFSWALIAPLAIPTFIMSIIYSGITDVTGPLAHCVSFLFPDRDPFYLDIMNFWGLSFTLSFALFPYVYLSSLIAFRNKSKRFEEASKNLGLNDSQVFFKVSLRMAMPFIFSGILLIMMELLNDYGAMKYYGYNTLTTGIFKAWFDLNDLTSSIYLSGILFLFVLIMLYLKQRNKRNTIVLVHEKTKLKDLFGWKKWITTFYCSLIVFFSFILPAVFIVKNGIKYFSKVSDATFLSLTITSVIIAFIAALIILILGILFSSSKRVHLIKWFKMLLESNNVGYAIPGAIIAIGVIALAQIFQIHSGMILLSFALLIYAYVVRFLSSGFQSIDNALSSQDIAQDESARSMGHGSFSIFRRIHLPQLKTALVVAFLFAFIEVIKELPLTLILKPFNFESLATITFQYAKDEMLLQACVPAMFILIITMIPNYMIHKYLQRT